jgi:hypothetical protein
LAKDGHQAIYAKTISRTFQRLLPRLALAVGPGVAPPRLHCLRVQPIRLRFQQVEVLPWELSVHPGSYNRLMGG